MGANLDPSTLLDFIDGDFETAWNAMAAAKPGGSGGNFMFGKQAAVLLELACRMCTSDPAALADFGTELNKKDPRYFWQLPVKFWKARDFTLPTYGGVPTDQTVLGGIFDLVRNGQAHQYQQIAADTSDGKTFYICLTGVHHPGRTFAQCVANAGSHLALDIEATGDVSLKVRPEVWFSDLWEAIGASGLKKRGLTIKHLDRIKAFQGVSSADLAKSLTAMHANLKRP